MEQTVRFSKEKTPVWSALVEALAARQIPIGVRMIDGELAFPDDTPPDAWRELRVGTPGGMITLRRESDGITLVVWGNADARMRESWNALALALAELTGGVVNGQSAAEFAKLADLPAHFKVG